MLRPADIGLIASLGIGEVSVRASCASCSSPPATKLVSVGKKLKAGGSVRLQSLHTRGMLTRLGCESDRSRCGARRSEKTRSRVRKAAAVADAVVTSGGVSVGEGRLHPADNGEARRSRVLENRHAPGAPDGLWPHPRSRKIGVSLRPARNPGRRLVTFYHFVRGALLTMMGRTDTDLPLCARKPKPRCARNPAEPNISAEYWN